MTMVWCNEGVDDEAILSYPHSPVVPLRASGEGSKHGQRTFRFFEAVYPESKGDGPFSFPPFTPNRPSSLGPNMC